MLSAYSVQNPRFAIVLSMAICLAGMLAITNLVVTMYPKVGFPQITVSALYPGANAKIVAETVIQPIEERLAGLSGLLYLDSTANNNGMASIVATLNEGADETRALVEVQTLLSEVENVLPDVVRSQGLSVSSNSNNLLMTVNVYSPDDTRDRLYLSNYTSRYILSELNRIKGVDRAIVFGEMRYAMRLWLRPNDMYRYGLSVSDISNAIKDQNVFASAGKVGQEPNSGETYFEYTIRVDGSLDTEDDFENIILISKIDGAQVLLKQVADVELGSQDYAEDSKLDNKANAMIGIYQRLDGNALNISEEVHKKMAEMAIRFPDDLAYVIEYDTSQYVRSSIAEVLATLFTAAIIVMLVVFFFLKSARATLVPALAIPVSLLGTFAVLYLMGYSVNIVSLLAMVLAIGIVVDDAIIVIERVDYIIKSTGKSSYQATLIAMKSLTKPIVATTMVLLAVFIPVSFMAGVAGSFYREFSVTIAVAVCISSLCALTLSPAICSLMTGLRIKSPDEETKITYKEGVVTLYYRKILTVFLNHNIATAVILLSVIMTLAILIDVIPKSFLPEEDQGVLIVMAQLPDAAALNRTNHVMAEITRTVNADPAVKTTITISGFNFIGGNSSNSGLAFLVLEDWSERNNSELSASQTAQRLADKLNLIDGANIYVFSPPSVQGVGSVGGFELRLLDLSGQSPLEMESVAESLIAKINNLASVSNAFTSFRANIPQYTLKVDKQKAKAMGIELSDIYDTLQSQLGSLYVNNFNRFGKQYRVILQAAQEYRDNLQDLEHYFVSNKYNEMVPLSAIADLERVMGPASIFHFNGYQSLTINGEATQGQGLINAIAAINALESELPNGYSLDWSGQAKNIIETDGDTLMLFLVSMMSVYLFLVVLYESWLIPIPIIAVVPIACLGGYFAMWMVGIESDTYAQMGLVLLIGLSAKNGILIVEQALELLAQGKSILDATIQSALLRLRAISMTTLSFMFGVVPLVLAVGAGAGARLSLGVVLIGGTFAISTLGVLFMPVMFRWTMNIRSRSKLWGRIDVN